MQANRINRNLGVNKVIPVCIVLFCGLILTSGPELRAQESVDLSSKPEPSAAIIQQDNSTPSASTSETTIDAPVIPRSEQVLVNGRDTPPEWGQGADAYGIRFASGFGRSVISRTIAFGVAAVDREDPRFVPSNESGIWRRTRHAIVGTFVSRTPTGGSMPAFSRFVGVYSAGFIANAWEPRSQNDTGHALERGSTALLSSVGWHVFEEFWPDIRGAFHRH